MTLGASPATPEPSAQGSRAKRQSRRRPGPNTQQDPEREPKPDKGEQSEQKGRQRPTRVRKESRGDEGAAKEGETRERGKGRRRRGNVSEKGPEEGGGDTAAAAAAPRKLPPSVTTVYLGGIPAWLRVSELKSALRERDAAPLRLTWQGAQHRAFLDYSDPPTAEQALAALQYLSVNGHSLQAELAKSQRGGKRSGQSNRRPRAAAATAAAPKNKAAPDVKGDTSEVTTE